MSWTHTARKESPAGQSALDLTLQEYSDPLLLGQSNWHIIKYETKRMRNPSI